MLDKWFIIYNSWSNYPDTLIFEAVLRVPWEEKPRALGNTLSEVAIGMLIPAELKFSMTSKDATWPMRTLELQFKSGKSMGIELWKVEAPNHHICYRYVKVSHVFVFDAQEVSM